MHLKRGKIEDATHDTVREKMSLHSGIEVDDAKKMIKEIKQLKLKVQAQIMERQGPRHRQEARRVAVRDRTPEGSRPGIPAPVRQSYLTGRMSASLRVQV